MITTVVILVVLSALAAGLSALGSAQHIKAAQDAQASRAWHAAVAGNEWGLHRVLRGGAVCDATFATTLDLTAETGMRVLVECSQRTFKEGESAGPPSVPRDTAVMTISATACSAAVCPALDARAAAPGYVERKRVVTVTN